MALQGQDVVIVGGSSGIGFETAKLALQQGAKVTITGRSQMKLAQAKSLLTREVRTVVADVADEVAVKCIFEGLARVDRVLITAGSLTVGKILETDPNEFRQGLEERIFGTLYVVRAAVPRMPDTGSITLMSGTLASKPVPGMTMTTVGVAAAEALTPSLALELAPIRVNAVAPGWIDTPLLTDALGDNYDTVVTSVSEQLLVKRIGKPTEVAEAVIMLMNNGFITGEVLHIDGGDRYVRAA